AGGLRRARRRGAADASAAAGAVRTAARALDAQRRGHHRALRAARLPVPRGAHALARARRAEPRRHHGGARTCGGHGGARLLGRRRLACALTRRARSTSFARA
ncbi:hypothetical protein T492DRAFT_911993, partial [Pavlovales sp. CCMP2436]